MTEPMNPAKKLAGIELFESIFCSLRIRQGVEPEYVSKEVLCQHVSE
jgi:hypothetical protein